jgi:hypothetical protein
MLRGTGNLRGLLEKWQVCILLAASGRNPAREGLVCFWADGVAGGGIAALNAEGVRTHVRKADHYSGSIHSTTGPISGRARVHVPL